MEAAWALSLRDQCVAARVPFFFKQWGGVLKRRTGREPEAAIRMKPSELALDAATTIAVLGPRRHKKLRRVATKVATGAAHSLVARVGRRGPAALQAALGRGNRGTAGVEPVGDAAPRPGERTDA
jgi:Protein of unknown function (DUF5131)